jgi:hypothetical protein
LPERISAMPHSVYSCLEYSDRVLSQASQSTEPDRAALIAQAQVAALQAVANAIRDLDNDLSEALRQAARLQRGD